MPAEFTNMSTRPSRSATRSTSATVAPWPASISAVRRPIPEAAPVAIATAPASTCSPSPGRPAGPLAE
jgi:hypothetical protein